MRERAAATPALRCLRAGYREFCDAEVLDPISPGGLPGFAFEHAALIETSLMLLLHPDLVRLDRLPDDGPAGIDCSEVYPQGRRDVPPFGALASASGASTAHGARIFTAICEGFSAAVAREFPVSLASGLAGPVSARHSRFPHQGRLSRGPARKRRMRSACVGAPAAPVRVSSSKSPEYPRERRP